MVWGTQRGIDDLVERVAKNDPQLESLCIFRNRNLTESDAQKLFRALAENTVLRELHLSSHRVSRTMVEALATALKTNQSLYHLNIGDGQFGDDELHALCACLSENSSLRILDLENKSITEKGCQSLAEALKGNTSVKELWLSGNRIGARGVSKLASGVQNINFMALSSCGINEEEAGHALVDLFQGEECRTSLKTLILDNNGIDSDTIAISGEMISLSSLINISLKYCPLGPKGCSLIVNRLPPCIQELDLSNSEAGCDGIKSLACRLRSGDLPSLRRLSVSYCNGMDDSCAELASSISLHNEMIDLDLSGNSTMKLTMDGLSVCNKLRCLRMHGCCLGSMNEDDWQQLTSNETIFSRLEEFDISGNDLSEIAMAALMDGLITNSNAMPSLKHFVIAANPGALNDSITAKVEQLQIARPHLSIIRKNADRGEL